MAREYRSIPWARSRFPPGWKPFSMAMPMPATWAPACSMMVMRPWRALPFARKSSMIRMFSPGFRYFLDTMT